MKNIKRKLLVGALAGALAGVVGGALFAQTTTVVQNLTGTEITQVSIGTGGPGGTGFYTTVNALRNATGYLLVAGGTTVNTTVPQTAAKVIVTGAITTWGVTLPASPYDGEDVAIACPGGSGGTVTVSAAATPAGTSIVGTALTACASGGVSPAGGEFVYSTAQNKWYRIQ